MRPYRRYLHLHELMLEKKISRNNSFDKITFILIIPSCVNQNHFSSTYSFPLRESKFVAKIITHFPLSLKWGSFFISLLFFMQDTQDRMWTTTIQTSSFTKPYLGYSFTSEGIVLCSRMNDWICTILGRKCPLVGKVWESGFWFFDGDEWCSHTQAPSSEPILDN